MKRILIPLCLLAVLLRIAPGSRAVGLIILDEGSESIAPGETVHSWPRPVPRPIYRLTALEIRSAKVSATINDQVAHTKIEEEFYNPNPRRLEGTFILPLPKGAHLEKFALEINGKMAEAELLSADKAKGIYEEIVRKAKDPALLEYVGRDLLKVRIFPIEPNSTKRIELSYDQLLTKDADLIEYSVPMNTAQYCAEPIKSFSLTVDLISSTPLKTIYSPSHTIDVVRNTGHTARIVFEQSNVKPEKDFKLFYSARQSDLGLNFLTYRSPGEDGYFLLLASPGIENTKTKVMPKDVVFVLDTSGSMNGKKIVQAKKALAFCINNLNNEDRFEIIRFASEAEAFFQELMPVSSESREKAEAFVENLKTLGGTAINDALRKALALRPAKMERPFLVVFLTDGLPTVGDTSEQGILRTVTDKKEDLTRVFCFGIGTDVNTRLLDRMAEETGAVAQYVLPEEDLEIKVSSFFTKISDPVLAGVELEFGKGGTSKIHPGKLPDLFKGQQLVVVGRYSKSGATTATLTGTVGGEKKSFRYEVEFPKTATEQAFIPRLWATRRVGYLLEQMRLHGESGELKEEVTELARKYAIVTPYTSFLVQEDEPVRLSLGETRSINVPSPSALRFERLGRADQPAQEAERLRSLRLSVSGDSAVAASRYSEALKSALSDQEARFAGRELQQFATTGKLEASVGQATKESVVRVAAGRTFLLEQGVWTEASLAKDSAPKRIAFDSPEYWELVASHPELREILALGAQLKFALDGRVYEIYSPESGAK